MSDSFQKLLHLQNELKRCNQCPEMQGPPVHGEAVLSPIMLIGQAPGPKEISVHKPFAWTAGKTLFSWFESIGIDEDAFRQRIYMTAVCRCFPGKKEKGGDRVPNRDEINHCSQWLKAEVRTVKPSLVLLVGKLAINQVLSVNKLSDVVGTVITAQVFEHPCDVIPLPHPSGASTWHRTEPGKQLLSQALAKIKQHPAWLDMLAAG